MAFIGDENAQLRFPPSSHGSEQRMIKRRNRRKHTKTFQDRLLEEAARFKEAADKLPPGTARELLLKRVRQAEIAADIDRWLGSPGLQPPKAISTLTDAK